MSISGIDWDELEDAGVVSPDAPPLSDPPATRRMIPALTLVVASYTTLRFLEVMSGKDTKTAIRAAAAVLLLLSFVSCSVATFGGAGSVSSRSVENLR